METLTKKQRREIYLKAIELIKTSTAANTICIALYILHKFEYKAGEFTITACKIFPEFASFAPPERKILWFRDNDERIVCLNKCAEMCKD